MDTAHYMQKHGPALAALGYELVPIKKMQKGCFEDGWADWEWDPSMVDKWQQKFHGVGIRCGNVVGVDVDSTDPKLVAAMKKYMRKRFGHILVRVGQSPKFLVPFQATTPFSSIKSPFMLDDKGAKHRLEIIAKGGQFVAYNVHPDTKRPYRWLLNTELHKTPVSKLPIITLENARELVDAFTSMAMDLRGFEPKRGSKPGRGTVYDDAETVVPLDPSLRKLASMMHGKSPLGLQTKDLRLLVDAEDPDDYDSWINVGMIIAHETRKSPEGFNLWDEWSQQSEAYDSSVMDKHWRSFGTDDSPELDPMNARTARSLIADRTTELAEQLDNVKDEEGLAAFKRQVARCTYLRGHDVDRLTKQWRKKSKDITGYAPSAQKVARQMQTRASNVNVDMLRSLCGWWADWVYVAGEDSFYNRSTSVVYSRTAFDGVMKSMWLPHADALERGPECPPNAFSYFAHRLNGEMVDRVVSLPGAERLHTYEGERVFNVYRDQRPMQVEKVDKAVLERFKFHVEHLLTGDEEEANLIYDWLAYTVAQPQVKLRWALVLTGGQGVGKSYLTEVVRACLGRGAVSAPSQREVMRDFDDYLVGKKLVSLEEISGAKKFHMVYETFKEVIANSNVRANRKGKQPIDIENRINVIMYTNHPEDVKLTEADRRISVVASPYQSRVRLLKDGYDHHYFDALYADLEKNGDHIYTWLAQRTPQILPTVVPDTRSRRDQIDISQDGDEIRTVMQQICEGDECQFVDYHLISTSHLIEELKLYTEDYNARAMGHRTADVMREIGLVRAQGQLRRKDGGRTRVWYDPDKYEDDDAAREAYKAMEEEE